MDILTKRLELQKQIASLQYQLKHLQLTCSHSGRKNEHQLMIDIGAKYQYVDVFICGKFVEAINNERN